MLLFRGILEYLEIVVEGRLIVLGKLLDSVCDGLLEDIAVLRPWSDRVENSIAMSYEDLSVIQFAIVCIRNVGVMIAGNEDCFGIPRIDLLLQISD